MLTLTDLLDFLCMKLNDKTLGKFLVMTFGSALLNYVLVCLYWLLTSGVSWFEYPFGISICLSIALCWIIGALIAWKITPETKRRLLVPFTFLFTVCLFAISFGIEAIYADASTIAWVILFFFFFAILSLPGAVILFFLSRKLFKQSPEPPANKPFI